MYFNKEKNRWETMNGYVWKRKDSEQLLNIWLYLGINDSIENYEEVLMPIENE